MPDEDPNQMKFDFARESENVVDNAPPAPGPMSARTDHATTTLQRHREMLAQQARAGDRAALRRYLQLRRR